MNYVGIDLGKDGGIIVLNQDGGVLKKYKTPLLTSTKAKPEYDIPAMVKILKEIPEPKVVTIEKSQPMPMVMGGVAANFQRGLSFGLWQGVLVALGISYDVVSARAWQKRMLADINVEDTKQASVIACQRLWPKEDWRKSERARNPDIGFTDAALISEFGRRSRSALQTV